VINSFAEGVIARVLFSFLEVGKDKGVNAGAKKTPPMPCKSRFWTC